MLGDIFSTVLYQPLYNGLILLMDVLPVWADAGVAVILFTIIVKLILFPLSKKSVSTQLKMKALQPALAELKEKHKNDRQKQAEATMKLYRDRDINPLSGLFLILIQLPIIITLYWVFLKSGLPEVNMDLLYSFIPPPETINMDFFGQINLGEKSYLLALVASVTSFFQIRYSMPKLQPSLDGKKTFKDDLARSMNVQMRYVFPVVIFFVAYNISGAVALYWATSNMFTIAQELVIRKQVKEPYERAEKEAERKNNTTKNDK